MDPKIAEKRMKKRRAPPPPNPFTGEVELPTPTSDGDENEEVGFENIKPNILVSRYTKMKFYHSDFLFNL